MSSEYQIVKRDATLANGSIKMFYYDIVEIQNTVDLTLFSKILCKHEAQRVLDTYLEALPSAERRENLRQIHDLLSKIGGGTKVDNAYITAFSQDEVILASKLCAVLRKEHNIGLDNDIY